MLHRHRNDATASPKRSARWQSLVGGSTPSDPRISAKGDIVFTSSSWVRGSLRQTIRLHGSQPESREIVRLESSGFGARFSPDGSLLAWLDAAGGSAIRIADVETASVIESIAVPGMWRPESLEWYPNGSEILLVAAPPDADLAVGQGAKRSRSADKPFVRTAHSGTRRIIAVSLDAGSARVLDTGAATIWEAVAFSDGTFAAVVSDDPSESGWYSARLVRLSETAPETTLHDGDWQIARPTLSPDESTIALVEGWSSDRGYLAGSILLVDPTGLTDPVHLGGVGVDVVSSAWASNSRLGFWGWCDLTAAYGSVDVQRATEPKIHVLESVVEVGLGSGRESVDVVSVTNSGLSPARITAGIAGAVTFEIPVGSGDFGAFALDSEPVSWESRDGTEISGFLVTPRDPAELPAPLVVMIHGGPANLWKDSLPVGAVALAEAGYALLLPNPRGSVGKGDVFAKANLGDPAGAELDDVLSGAAMCRARETILDQPVGVVGGSYGGYLTTCAAVFGEQVGGAVAMFGHPDLLSARYSSNNPGFYDRLVDGDISGDRLKLAVDRSPVFHVDSGTAPTLLLHGDNDACTPLGQSEEMHRALVDAHIPTELVVYPGEGHGLRSPWAQIDIWNRTVEWFDCFVKGSSC